MDLPSKSLAGRALAVDELHVVPGLGVLCQ